MRRDAFARFPRQRLQEAGIAAGRLQGKQIKAQAAKQAAANAERLYEAIVEQRRKKLADPSAPTIATSDLIFDPTQPVVTDWEKLLADATKDIIRKRRKRTDN